MILLAPKCGVEAHTNGDVVSVHRFDKCGQPIGIAAQSAAKVAMHVNGRELRSRQQSLADFQFRRRSKLANGWDWELLFRRVGGGVSRGALGRLLCVTDALSQGGNDDGRK